MVESVYFPVKVKGKNFIIDPAKMKVNVIYCFCCDGENYQAEIEENGTIIILREALE